MFLTAYILTVYLHNPFKWLVFRYRISVSKLGIQLSVVLDDDCRWFEIIDRLIGRTIYSSRPALFISIRSIFFLKSLCKNYFVKCLRFVPVIYHRSFGLKIIFVQLLSIRIENSEVIRRSAIPVPWFCILCVCKFFYFYNKVMYKNWLGIFLI